MPSELQPLSAARQANLRRLLNPRHIAFIGGESAGMAIRVCREAGYRSEIFALHPKRREIEGIACLPSIADLPLAPDACFLGIPADATIEGDPGHRRGGAVCYASGFAEIGGVGRQRHDALVAASGDLALVGPNCFGLVNYVNNGSMWLAAYLPGAGPRGAAIVGQSGNVCIHFPMNQRDVPFSYIISAGNQAVLGFEDYIEYLAGDPNVTAIGLFLEGIRDVPAFSRACLTALERGIPVIACRAGVSDLGARLAASHTSSLAGSNELYDALLERLGILSAPTVARFLELLKLASRAPLPGGRRLAVFSSSGGDNGMAADYASAAGLDLPQPNESQRSAIKAMLPDYAQVSNPLDFTAGYWGAEERLTPMFRTMLQEGGYDLALIVLDHPRMELGPEPRKPLEAMVRALGAAARGTKVIVGLASVDALSMPESMRRYALDHGLMPLQGLDDACAVLARWAAYAAFRRKLEHEGPPAPPAALATLDPQKGRLLDEWESKTRLAAFGLPVPAGVVTDAAEIGQAAGGFDGPVAIKALSAALPHKTEAGAVMLGILGPSAAGEAARRIGANLAAHKPDLRIDRFLVEPMVEGAVGELLVGVKRDPQFGLVLVIAAGGILVELLRDSVSLLLPVTEGEVEAALRRLKSFALFDGFRGRPRADLPAAITAILAIARYAEANRELLLELDVNPLMLLPEGRGALAVDALIVEAAGS
ncbi:MAG TPA: acetate--CoA ligase family protein [Dongiaceae bacterium]|nr:acetate--CoA ligase family protein [Dongiaceae bacterium]